MKWTLVSELSLERLRMNLEAEYHFFFFFAAFLPFFGAAAFFFAFFFAALGWDAFVAFFAFGPMPTQLSTVSTTFLILLFFLAMFTP